MIGGYQILDLRGLNLQISASASSIIDPFVLKQLSMLNAYIDKAYNFNKPLVNQLKPVLIRFRDKKNGEKTEGATFGEMSVVGNYYTFKITGRISGQFTLIINVAFHEVTNAYGNKEWLINTATIQLADASNVLEGDIAIDGDLSVSGDVEVGNDSKVKILENIVDKAGNYRFIEGDLSVEEIEGITFTYAKWSLSGTHLMFVLAGEVSASASISAGKKADVNLPSWIASKIYPTATSYIDIKTIQAFDLTSLTTQNVEVSLRKYGDANIRIETGAVTGGTNGYGFRIAFDLLIDDDFE